MLSAPLNILISEIDTHSETKFFHCDEQGIFLHVFTNDKIVETIILKHTLCSKIFLILPSTTTSPKWKWKSLSPLRLFATPWTIQSMEFSRAEYWNG